MRLTRRRRTSRRVGALLAAVLATTPAATGCGHDSSATAPMTAPTTAAGPSPTSPQGNAASTQRVTLSSQAARRLGIETGLVGQARNAAPGGSGLTVIPITALIYDPEGGTWAYTAPSNLYTASAGDTFVRKPVVIDRIDGSLVYLRSGPGVGTPVVTVGAPELLGSEYGVGEE